MITNSGFSLIGIVKEVVVVGSETIEALTKVGDVVVGVPVEEGIG